LGTDPPAGHDTRCRPPEETAPGGRVRRSASRASR